jgi:hypothetical protein
MLRLRPPRFESAFEGVRAGPTGRRGVPYCALFRCALDGVEFALPWDVGAVNRTSIC